MISKEDCFILGQINHVGKHGEVYLRIDADDPGNYKNLEFILIEINNQLVPYEVLRIAIKGNTAELSLSGIDEGDQASVLIRASVFLPMDKLPELKGKEFYIHELKGFTMIEHGKGPLGIIDNVYDLPHHTIASLSIEGQEVLVPLRKELIVNINREEKTISLNIPDGLLDIYLG